MFMLCPLMVYVMSSYGVCYVYVNISMLDYLMIYLCFVAMTEILLYCFMLVICC